MLRTRIAHVLSESQPGEVVNVRGWVRTRRDSKQGFSFIEVNDGSCFKGLQIVIDADVRGYDVIKDVTTGCSVCITGEVKESPGKGQRVELQATELRLLGTSPADSYPLQKKGHSFEFLREIAHLRPRTNTFGAITRVRNAAATAIHDFFQSRGFYYIQTPVITTSDCEGAGQMFTVTTLNLERIAEIQTQIDYAQDFFGKRAALTVSGQLEAEIFACSLGECYTFGPTFRAENSNTTRHLAEFWMVEPEMPFYDLTDNMELAEAFIRHVISDLLLKSGQKFEYPVEWGCDLQSEHERWLTEQHFRQPVILHDYPRSIKPFYMRCNEDGKTVRAMDVLVPRVGEIIGGSQREERLDVLESRMTECGLEPQDYWWYCDLRRYGTVPHSGFGLGFERLIQLITGMQNIRDCIPFPRVPKSAEF
ncbi:MAG: asparagine--tRNA ligase [Planctomycetota bacterium]|jgi:asparaginyl-tRNA synthetase